MHGFNSGQIKTLCVHCQAAAYKGTLSYQYSIKEAVMSNFFNWARILLLTESQHEIFMDWSTL